MSALNDKLSTLIVTVFIVIGLSAAMKPTLAADGHARPASAVSAIVVKAPAVAQSATVFARVVRWVRAIDAASPTFR
jgi:hypothetical protein